MVLRLGQQAVCCWKHQVADLRDTVKEVEQLAIQNAFKRRHHHRGPMAEFKQALALVLHVRQGGEGPMFASWF